MELFQPNVIVNGNDMTFVMQIACYTALFKFLLIAYLWPIKINNDEYGSRGYGYIFTCKFWKETLCCHKKKNNP